MITLPIWNTQSSYTVSPSKIIALGLNYADHIQESEQIALNLNIEPAKAKNILPTEPILFPKTPNVLIGHEDTIIIPQIAYEYGFEDVRTDLEAELAIIIKDQCHYVKEEDAYRHIFGYTAMNDVSQRNIQKSDKGGWFRGKSFDTFGPIGPQLILHEDLIKMADPQDLVIKSKINGELKQLSNTKHMIFTIPQIVAFISKNFTLYPGDIILTGTPEGVAAIHPGDVIEIEIEHIGILRNFVEKECIF